MNPRYTVILFLVLAVVVGGAYYLTAVRPLHQQVNQGLDLAGGMHVVLEAVETQDAPVTDETMNNVVRILERRANGLGVTEPVIQRQGARRVIIELPGIKSTEEALEAIGRTAILEFVDEEGNLLLTGRDLARNPAADIGYGQDNRPHVKLFLTPEGRQKFAAATTANFGKRIFILLDKEVISAPVVTEKAIEEPIITGYHTVEEAQRLAVVLNSGALPVKLEVAETRSVSATLGQDSLHRSLVAGVIGVAAVALFMAILYGVSGLMANIALVIYGFIVLAVFVAIDATLTLPGIAGFILSIGMAVDANVITYERIREELRGGKTLRAAIESGYGQAFRTILDANVTTLIGAGVLFYYGTGPIRGFAVTLSIGILTSMFTAVVISRILMRLTVRTNLIRNTKVLFGA